MVFPLWCSTAVIVPSKVIVLYEHDVNLTFFVVRFLHFKESDPRLFLVLKLSCLIVPTTWPAYFDLLFVQWISYVDLKKYFPNAGVLLTTGFGQQFLDAALSFSKNLSLIKSFFPVGSLCFHHLTPLFYIFSIACDEAVLIGWRSDFEYSFKRYQPSNYSINPKHWVMEQAPVTQIQLWPEAKLLKIGTLTLLAAVNTFMMLAS